MTQEEKLKAISPKILSVLSLQDDTHAWAALLSRKCLMLTAMMILTFPTHGIICNFRMVKSNSKVGKLFWSSLETTDGRMLHQRRTALLNITREKWPGLTVCL